MKLNEVINKYPELLLLEDESTKISKISKSTLNSDKNNKKYI